ELSGFQVHVARTGPEALETALSERPDLVLMDINMPRLDGIEVIRRLRSDEHAVHIPIVTVTAMSDDRERSLAAGANHYLSKPIDLDKLDVLLNHYFG
ncbi:MAG: response regulator, partial [Caldilineaceae bacterium]|nr:response regulator [Caldilineaceae bacterium]